jgi:hypothetical protein
MAATATYADSRAAHRDRWTPWIVAVLATAFFGVICAPVFPHGRQHDFLSFYTGAQIARSGDYSFLYDLARQGSVQRSVVPGREVVVPYIRPPFYAMLLAPLSRFPLNAAFAGWASAQILVLLGIWWWAYRRFGPDAMVFCTFFFPAIAGIAHGQDNVFLAAVLLTAWVLLERRRDGLAGAVAALGLVKFHLMLLVVPALMIRRRWRMLAAYAAVAAVEGGVSLMLIGPAGVGSYWKLLTARNVETLSPSPEKMINIRALLTNLNLDAAWVEAGMAIVVVMSIVLVCWKTTDDWVWFWGTIFAGVLMVPHSYEYDAALLLPPILLCIFDCPARALRLAAAAAVLPPAYFCTVFGPPWAIAPSLVLSLWFILLVRRGVTQS